MSKTITVLLYIILLPIFYVVSIPILMINYFYLAIDLVNSLAGRYDK
jgi:hypothetical protein